MSKFKTNLYKKYAQRNSHGLPGLLQKQGFNPYRKIDLVKEHAKRMKDPVDAGKASGGIYKSWGDTVEKEVIKAKTGIDPSKLGKEEYEKKIGPIRKKAIQKLYEIRTTDKKDNFYLG